MREHPDGVLARGLSTPLTLTLLRDTYQPGDDVEDLLDTTRYSTAEHIERSLIARVLPAGYTPRPGRPPPGYSEAEARQALTFLARWMNQDHTRDLAWWQIPRWASAMPRVFTAGLAHRLVLGLGGWLVDGLIGLGSGLMAALMLVLVVPRACPVTPAWRQLKLSGHVPAVSLMPFLEDARDRGVLRTVGGVYQFRHATLQDQLAEQTAADSAVSRVS